MRKIRKAAALLLCAALMLCTFSSCGTRSTEVQYVIGVSLANLSEQWRLVLKNELEEEARKYSSVRLVMTDAADDREKQIRDLDRLMSFDIDLLIVSPCDVEALTPEISRIYSSIPVIVLDRAVEAYDYTLFIGPDNRLIGRQAGTAVLDILAEAGIDGGTVLELKSDSYASADRSAEFLKTVTLAGVRASSFDLDQDTRDCAEDSLLAHPELLENVDVIFAHNDFMAYGATLALEKLGLQDIRVVGLDGFPGEGGGRQMVRDGILDATVTCPTGGREAIRFAIDIINRVSGIPKQIILRSHLIRPDTPEEAAGQVLPEPVRVGHAQIDEDSRWREASNDSIHTAARDFNVDLTVSYSPLSLEIQKQQVRDFIAQKMDVIVISPVVADGWEDVLSEARAAGIPVLLLDRMADVSEDLYTSFIGADFEEEGRRCAKWLLSEVPEGEVRIFELRGTDGSSPAAGRKSGFESALAGEDRMRIVRSECGDFSREEGYRIVSALLASRPCDFDVIYAHNDDMALGAADALKEHGIRPGTDVLLVSIDGGSAALTALQKGEHNCVVECNPLLGPQLMKAIADLTQGDELPLRIITDESVFTAQTPAEAFRNRKY